MHRCFISRPVCAASRTSCTRRARTKGVRPGFSLAQARSIIPKLIARGRDSACERTAQEALVEVAETFSPRVEDAEDGLVFVDVSGTERMFGGSQVAGRESENSNPDQRPATCDRPINPEHLLAQSAMHAIEAIGLPPRIGIAASKLAARVA